MASTTFTHYVTVVGNDIEAKRAKKIKKGDSLSASRICDEIDTYEILISTTDLEPIEMLGYVESLGISPFLDNQQAKISSITVTDIILKPGAKRSEDETSIFFDMVLEYDESVIVPLNKYSFIPLDNIFYAAVLYSVWTIRPLNLITRTHLNRYKFSVSLSDDMIKFYGFEKKNEECLYCVEALFSEDFSKAKIEIKLLIGDILNSLDVRYNEYLSLIDLINHHRIFEDEEPLGDIQVDGVLI